MDQKLLREREARCIQECLPGCSAACPVHVDVRGMIRAVRSGDYAAGYAVYSRLVAFPRIISRICDQPCQNSCKRSEIDTPISIRALEQACVNYTDKTPPAVQPLPARNYRVAVIGAGLGGLAAALELARKGCGVVVFEAASRRGGRIWDHSGDLLPENLIESDFSVFDALPVEFRYNSPVGRGEGDGISFAGLCDEFDAVYLSVGSQAAALADFGLDRGEGGALAVDPLTLATGNPKVFAGGGLRRSDGGWSPISSISDGKIAATSIDRLLQQVSLSANRSNEGPFTSCLYTNIEGVILQNQLLSAGPGGYSKEEAECEANRCILCECLECVKDCEFLANFGAYPKRYVREVYNNLSIVMGMHHANKMINSCSLCGLCAEVCPGTLDMGEICLEARRQMVKKGKMPPSTHDFALRDMQYSNSDRFTLAKHQPGHISSSVVFYPGCQLAASDPHKVKMVYSYLCEKLAGGVGLMLGCCGAPAYWAGQEDLFDQALQQTGKLWRELGSPKIITACPTCQITMGKYLPEAVVESLWTLLDELDLPAVKDTSLPPLKLAVHDSCTTRHDEKLQNSVRSIMGKLGCEIEELPRSRSLTTCCAYGGLMMFANVEVADKEIIRRTGESETDYLTYCSMCRDNFAGVGKRAYHLLDLIFGTDLEIFAVRKGPGYSERQNNRSKLKVSMLREIWGEDVTEPQNAVKLIIPEDVKKVLEERFILESDVSRVIEYAESTGNKLRSADSGCIIAYHKLSAVTYWVEYTPEQDGFLIHNSYCHRIEILE